MVVDPGFLVMHDPKSRIIILRQMWLALRAGRSWLRRYERQRIADTVVSSTFRAVIILLAILCFEVSTLLTSDSCLSESYQPLLIFLHQCYVCGYYRSLQVRRDDLSSQVFFIGNYWSGVALAPFSFSGSFLLVQE